MIRIKIKIVKVEFYYGTSSDKTCIKMLYEIIKFVDGLVFFL